MAAPSSTKWGNIAEGDKDTRKGQIGIYAGVTETATTVTVSIEVWFRSMYSLNDSSNSYYYNTGATSATTLIGSKTINHTVNTGSGWSTSNQTKLGSSSYTYNKGTSASTKYYAAKLTGIDNLGNTAMTVTTSVTVPALASYTVAYNMNGGSGSISSQTKYYGKALTLSSTKPTRTGYSFQGWATSASGSVAYKAGASYTANAAATLYAVWKVNTYTVSYNANGGGGQPSNQTKTYGKTLTLSSTKPTRTGYSFVSWNTKSDGSGTSYTAGASYTANAAVTLYAIWKINTYTITYNANGGTLGSVKTQTKNYGTALKLTGTATRTNYTFKGWATSADGSVAYASGANYTANAGVTLYAVWELSYVKPRINGLIISRCDSAGKISDEGTYAIVGFSWASDLTVSSIKIEWKLASATSYTNSEQVTASDKKGSVYKKVGGTIDPEKTYTFRVTVTDSNGSNYAIRNITGSVYHIDCKPPNAEDEVGGVSIGKPAELDGVFDVGFEARFRDSVAFDSPAAARASLKAWCFDITTNTTNSSGVFRYPGLAQPDGTTLYYVRTTQQGLLPYESNSTNGSGNVGTSGWPFASGHFKNLFADGYSVADYIADSGWKTATLSSDFVKYDGKDDNIPQYRKIGKQVQIRGTISPKTDIAGSTDAYLIFTLPEGYRPPKQVSVVSPGSGAMRWLLTITASGEVRFQRYNNGAGYVTATTAAWLPLHAMYFVD